MGQQKTDSNETVAMDSKGAEIQAPRAAQVAAAALSAEALRGEAVDALREVGGLWPREGAVTVRALLKHLEPKRPVPLRRALKSQRNGALYESVRTQAVKSKLLEAEHAGLAPATLVVALLAYIEQRANAPLAVKADPDRRRTGKSVSKRTVRKSTKSKATAGRKVTTRRKATVAKSSRKQR